MVRLTIFRHEYNTSLTKISLSLSVSGTGMHLRKQERGGLLIKKCVLLNTMR